MSLIPSSSSASRYRSDGTLPDYPIGCRFRPFNEILANEFLIKKVLGLPLPDNPIKEMDIYDHNPDDLPITISNGRERWMYFFVYMTEENNERRTPDGYWKLVESDEPIADRKHEVVAVLKNSFVFYMGDAPDGIKTKWKMEEFRPHSHKNRDDPMRNNWVVCKIEIKVPEPEESKKKSRKRRKRLWSKPKAKRTRII